MFGLMLGASATLGCTPARDEASATEEPSTAGTATGGSTTAGGSGTTGSGSSGPTSGEGATTGTSTGATTGATTEATTSDTTGGSDVLDVVLASGQLGAPAGCFFAGDSVSDAQGCSLYRLGVRLPDGAVETAERLTDETVGGAWQPSVTGGVLAYTRRSGMTLDVRRRLLDGPDMLGELVSPSPGVWAWPNLSTAGRLRVSRQLMTPPQCTPPMSQMCVAIARWSETVEVVEMGSIEVGGHDGFSLEDTWANPLDDTIVAGHGKYRRIGSGWPDCATSCADMVSSPMPIVLDTDTGVYRVLELVSTEPGFDGLPLVGCAHMAWSPDGARLLCTEQGTPELMAVGLQSRIYALSFDPAQLEDGGSGPIAAEAAPLFAHRLADELFDLAPPDRCDVFYHKYAEWCGDEGFVVATVGCALVEGGDTQLLHERVYLIDVRSPAAPVYHDLTAGLEASQGAARGTMTSFTATCAR